MTLILLELVFQFFVITIKSVFPFVNVFLLFLMTLFDLIQCEYVPKRLIGDLIRLLVVSCGKKVCFFKYLFHNRIVKTSGGPGCLRNAHSFLLCHTELLDHID